jgi:hypothetical protein
MWLQRCHCVFAAGHSALIFALERLRHMLPGRIVSIFFIAGRVSLRRWYVSVVAAAALSHIDGIARNQAINAECATSADRKSTHFLNQLVQHAAPQRFYPAGGKLVPWFAAIGAILHGSKFRSMGGTNRRQCRPAGIIFVHVPTGPGCRW